MKPILLLLGAAALGLAACDDPFDVDAQLPTNTDTLAVYALNNTQGSFLSGVSIAVLDQEGDVGPEVASVIMPNGAGPDQFDIALDITPEGKAIVYPPVLVTPGLGGAPVGLFKDTLEFAARTSAPRVDYETENPVILGEGEVVLLQVPVASCSFVNSRGRFMYAKLVVDSVRTEPAEQIFVRVTSDPNCGFRSFLEGIPKR